MITAQNTQPVANAGNDQTVGRKTLVVLDGSGSSDLNNDPLNYAWTIIAQPVGSIAGLTNPTSVNPTLVPDLDGTYVLQLIVNDGVIDSVSDTVTITASNNAPVLNPVGNQSVDLGQSLTFTMTGSDSNNDPLAFTATPLPLPENMTLNGSTGEVTFTPDGTQLGGHVVTMMISDGFVMDSETITITANQVGSPSGTTELTGRLLDTNDFVATGTETPIVGATVSILNTGITSTSDVQGNFSLTGLPSGVQIFDIDPATANLAPDGSPYAGFREKITLITDVTNVVTRPFYLPRIDASSMVTVVPGTETTVTNTNLGITMTVPADTAKNLDGSDFTEELSISEVPAGLAPAALPDELQPGLLITIQPPGVTFETPVPITFPNTDNLPTGTEVDLWSLDPETGTFMIVGTGTVNGSSISIDNGGIRAADWHTAVPPPPEPEPPADEQPPNPNTGNDPDDPVGPNSNNSPSDPDTKCSGSSTEVCSGNLTVEHPLASYRSLGKDRAPNLRYRSQSADPQPIVFNNPTIPIRSAIPSLMSAQLVVAGVEQGGSIFTDVSGLMESANETLRQAVQFDAAMFATGSYPYILTLTNDFNFSSVGAVVRERVLIRNEQLSPFGSGWTVDNLSRLFPQTNGDVVLAEGAGSTRVFKAQVPGRLVVDASRTTRSGATIIASGDLNEDGNLDVVVASGSRVRVHLGQGDGTFSSGVSYSVGSIADVVLADLDEDGAIDVLVPAPNQNQVRISYGNGTGVLEPFVHYSAAASGGGDCRPKGVTIADLNNDGQLDFAVACSNSREVVLRIGNGSRTFVLPTHSVKFTSSSPVKLVNADFNQDGNIDLVTANSGHINLLVGDGTGQFPTENRFGGISFGMRIKTGDWNADGWPDVAVSEVILGGNRVYVYQNNRVGGFLPVVTYFLRSTGTAVPHDLLTGDVTADGIVDLMTVNKRGYLSVLEGRGDGTFEEAVETTITGSFSLFGGGGTVGDWNGDGLLDVAVVWAPGGCCPPTILYTLLNTDPDVDYLSPLGDFSVLDEFPDGTYTRTMKDGVVVQYDTQGRQAARIDRNGNTTSYAYEGTSDRLSTITDPGTQTNLVTTFAYGADNRLDTITDPAGRVTTFAHDPNGNLISITDPDTSMRQFTYDPRHKMTTQTSKRGFVTQYEYNFAGRHVKATRGDGATRELIPGEMAGVIDPVSGMGTESNPAPVVRPSEVLATFTDGLGNPTTIRTDRYGRATITGDQLGRDTRIARNNEGNPVETTNPNGAITRRIYDDFGNVLSLVEAEGQAEERTTAFEYDPTFNQLTKVTDAEGKITTIELDTNGNPLKMINPLLDERTRTFNSEGLVLTDIDENGKITTFTYDANGNVDTITDAEGHVTQFTRDAAGNVLTITEGVGTPEVRTRTFIYDALNRLSSATDGTANPPTLFRYDVQGNLEETELATGEIETRTYDELNRVESIDDPIRGLTQFAYDPNGNLLSSTNALTDMTLFEYDVANQLKKITDALTGEQSFTYDVEGNVETFTDARSKTTTFNYDLLNRQTLRTNPLNQITAFTYDPRNNLDTTTDPNGQLIDRDYDELSRLFQIATPDNTITVTYDAASNPLTVGDTDSLVTFTYDGLNRVLNEGTTDLGAQPAVTLTSAYNAVGNRSSLTDILSSITSYDYDLAGRLTQLTMPASQIIGLAYDPVGRLDTIAYPNGVVSDYSYDTQGRLNSLTHTLGVNPSFTDFGYTYNPVGNVGSIIDNVTSAQTRTFTYDALQPLRTGGTTGAPEDYDYDLTGNRTTSFLSDTHTPDDANRLLEDDDFTYTYDLNGNLETKTSKAVPTDITTYTWDAQDQLIQIDFPDATIATYKYDGLGRRIENNVNGNITRYVYDGEDIALEYDGTNTFVARYSHGQKTDQPLALQKGAFFYYHADHQGSITHLTDSSGNIANSYVYDAYGQPTIGPEFVIQPFTYTGRELDQESGLYYYRARYYDANTGRFLREDPIGFNGRDQNLYRYVSNNPQNLVDPSGEMAGGSALREALRKAAEEAALAKLQEEVTPDEFGDLSDPNQIRENMERMIERHREAQRKSREAERKRRNREKGTFDFDDPCRGFMCKEDGPGGKPLPDPKDGDSPSCPEKK